MAIKEEKISLEQLMWRVVELSEKHYRYLTITSVELDEDNFELLYHFDLDLDLLTLRVPISKGRKVPSISPIYFASFWAENEIVDLMGIEFEGLKIDYHGTMYMEDDESTIRTPFCRYTTVSNKPLGKGEGK